MDEQERLVIEKWINYTFPRTNPQNANFIKGSELISRIKKFYKFYDNNKELKMPTVVKYLYEKRLNPLSEDCILPDVWYNVYIRADRTLSLHKDRKFGRAENNRYYMVITEDNKVDLYRSNGDYKPSGNYIIVHEQSIFSYLVNNSNVVGFKRVHNSPKFSKASGIMSFNGGSIYIINEKISINDVYDIISNYPKTISTDIVESLLENEYYDLVFNLFRNNEYIIDKFGDMYFKLFNSKKKARQMILKDIKYSSINNRNLMDTIINNDDDFLIKLDRFDNGIVYDFSIDIKMLIYFLKDKTKCSIFYDSIKRELVNILSHSVADKKYDLKKEKLITEGLSNYEVFENIIKMVNDDTCVVNLFEYSLKMAISNINYNDYMYIINISKLYPNINNINQNTIDGILFNMINKYNAGLEHVERYIEKFNISILRVVSILYRLQKSQLNYDILITLVNHRIEYPKENDSLHDEDCIVYKYIEDVFPILMVQFVNSPKRFPIDTNEMNHVLNSAIKTRDLEFFRKLINTMKLSKVDRINDSIVEFCIAMELYDFIDCVFDYGYTNTEKILLLIRIFLNKLKYQSCSIKEKYALRRLETRYYEILNNGGKWK